MLSNRTADQPSKFTLPLVDVDGSTIVGVSASWELFDEQGVSITAGVVTDFDASAGSVTFEIDAEHLTLADGEVSSGRELVVFVVTAEDDQLEVRDYFLVTSRTPLSIMENSFVSYTEALRYRAEFASLEGWDAAPRDRQMAAMAEAYRRLCRVSFKVPGANLDGTNTDKANYGTGTDEGWFWGSRVRISTMTPTQFNALPATFRTAIKRAQLAEANVLLGGDPVGKKRDQGIVSETTGESSMFFQSKPYLNLPVSRQAYEEIKRYVFLKVGVTRG